MPARMPGCQMPARPAKRALYRFPIGFANHVLGKRGRICKSVTYMADTTVVEEETGIINGPEWVCTGIG